MSNYSKQGYIQDLEDQNARLRATVRSLDSAGQEVMLKSFVILTGSIATEEMPPEAAQYVAELIPEPEKAPEPRIIPGTIESVSNEIGTYLNSLQTTSTDEQTSSHGTLKILKITAELPEHPNVIVSLFFQQLEQKPPEPGELFDISKTSIDIYIIDKL